MAMSTDKKAKMLGYLSKRNKE